MSVVRRGDAYDIVATARIHGDPRIVWETLTDYERLPQFVPGLEAVRVLERRTEAHREYLLVEQTGALSFLFFTRRVVVRLEVVHLPPVRIDARAVLPPAGGDQPSARTNGGASKDGATGGGRTRGGVPSVGVPSGGASGGGAPADSASPRAQEGAAAQGDLAHPALVAYRSFSGTYLLEPIPGGVRLAYHATLVPAEELLPLLGTLAVRENVVTQFGALLNEIEARLRTGAPALR